jgi:uncharacterized protein with PIN domain
MQDARPRFWADEMLGSLARWLRIMGYDTVYERDRSDDHLLEAALGQGRVLLTRDIELAQRAAPRSLLIESRDLDEQLQQVRSAYGLKAQEELVRCTVCNGELRQVTKEEARGKVPDGSLEGNDEFFACSICGKMYWKGAHWRNIRKRLSGLQ